MCITPTTLVRDYKTLDNRHTDVVPCGKCHECLKDRQNAWAFRLHKHLLTAKSACFLTLTYEQEPLSFNGHATLVKSDLQKFWKRVRKAYPKSSKTDKLKYFACGEYGSKTLRPHYHAIVYNLSPNVIRDSEGKAKALWTHGNVHILPCTMATIRYTCKYISKGTWQPTADDDDRQPQFSSMSKNLGLNYLTPQMVKYHVDGLVGHVTMEGGYLQKLPRYYKDKIFSKLEKQQIAREMQELRALNLNEWLDYDYEHEVKYKKDSIRRFEKQQKLQNEKI